MAEMSAEKAAEVLEEAARQAHQVLEAPTIFYDSKSMAGGIKTMQKCEAAYTLAVSLCRKLAAGELREVRHAHWIEEPGKIPRCSACGFYSDDADQYPILYCSNCGRRMDGKDGSDGQTD